MQLNSLLAKGLSYTLFCQAVIQFKLVKLALGESQRGESLRVREHASNFHANDKLLVLPQPEADGSLIDMLGKNNRQRRESLKFELSKLGLFSHFLSSCSLSLPKEFFFCEVLLRCHSQLLGPDCRVVTQFASRTN